jgi:hypothetical protein
MGSQSVLDVHDPDGRASIGGVPESSGAPASSAEQLAKSTFPEAHACVGAGKFAALQVVTGAAPIPHVCSPAPQAHSPFENMQQIPSVAVIVEAPG